MTKSLNIDVVFHQDVSKAFEYIYSHYYDLLCNKAYRIIFDRSSAEDVVQEVILELWKRKDSISKETPVLAYLKRSVYNRSINYIKSKSYSFEGEESIQSLEEDRISAIDQMIAIETQVKIEDVIGQLPEKCRYVFTLSRFEEKSYKEIASDLDISVKTVENQISKALKFLRKKIK